MRSKIKEVFSKGKSLVGKKIHVQGWIRTIRAQKSFAFIEVNDGSTLANLQVIVDPLEAEKVTTGASVDVVGEIVESPGAKQPIELKSETMTVLGACDPTSYVLQKKRHSFEFLRTIAHLRPRTNTFGAVMRVRNALAFAVHQFFQERGFYYIHTPIITSSDCEGGGELFRVTTLDPETPSSKEAQEFFGKIAYLTVSGQLNGEAYASALSDIYTFGPTFRAENSHTSRHLAEFWMIEPEMAFADLDADIVLAREFLKYLFSSLLEKCPDDLAFFDQFIEKGVVEKLQKVVEMPFEDITYTDAIAILEKSGEKFTFPVRWGSDLQSEHERYLAERHFKSPLVIRNFPKEIKAFYMRDNDDGKTVAAMDVLVPGVGEIIGGSQREDRLPILEAKMEKAGLGKKQYDWYLDLRRYGSVPHSGFGAGFERLIQFATGMENIRDVIPFPRVPGSLEY